MEPDLSSEPEFAQEEIRRAHRLAYWLIAGLALCFALVALWPTIRSGDSWSSRYDWRYFETMSEMARRSVLWYRELPLWNPYSCGGEVGLANPQSLEGSPTFLLVLLFGTPLGFKLSMLVYLTLGIFGMALLARRLDIGWTGSIVAGLSFGLSGYHALHLAVGHINFAGALLYPLLLYFFIRSTEDLRHLIWAGAVAGWIASLGGTFTPAMAGEVLILWATMQALWPMESEQHTGSRLRDGLRVYGLLVALGLLALCLSAYRMLPTLEFILDHPRPPFRRTPDVTLLKQVVFDLFAYRDFGPLSGRKYWSHEYTARLPQVVIPLLMTPLAVYLLRGKSALSDQSKLLRRLWLLTIVSILLSLGNFSPIAPWSLLQKLPVLRDLRVPSRHLVLAVLWLSLLAGLGVERVMSWLASQSSTRWPQRLVGLALIAAAGFDASLFFAHSFEDVFTVGIPTPRGPVPFFHVQGHWSQMRDLELQGLGVMGCDEEAPLQRADKLNLGDVPQYAFAESTSGQVLRYQHTPNRREITVELHHPGAKLLLNSNWNEHWKASPSTVSVVKEHGQLGLDLSKLPVGQHQIVAYYRPRSFVIGVILSVLSWLASLGLWRRKRLAAA